MLKPTLSAFLTMLILMTAGLPFALAFTGSYEETLTMSERRIAKFKVTAKGEFVKTEFLEADRRELFLRNETGTYRVIPEERTAMKLPDSSDPKNLLDDLDDYGAFLQRNQAKRIGSETLGEKETDIYEFLDPMTRSNSKAWVWKEKMLPIKIEVQSQEGVLTIELSNIDIASAIDDAVFALPEDYQVMTAEDASAPAL